MCSFWPSTPHLTHHQSAPLHKILHDDIIITDDSSVNLLACRFTEATKELQLLGLLRPCKRRRGACAQKLVFQSGHISTGADVAA